MATDFGRDGLRKAIIDDFTAHWVKGGALVYASPGGEDPGIIDTGLISNLGVAADAPSHLIHFDGERFLGPYPVA